MSEVERLIFELKASDLRDEVSEEPDDVDLELSEKKVTPLKLVKRKNNEYKIKKDRSKSAGGHIMIDKVKNTNPCGNCCCVSHCLFVDHGRGKLFTTQLKLEPLPMYVHSDMLDSSFMSVEEYEEEVTQMYESNDYFMDLLCSVNTNFVN